jgi:uracil-DNA glycosylase
MPRPQLRGNQPSAADIRDASKNGAVEQGGIAGNAHPSPLSAHRGFFGSRPFSKTNEALRSLGLAEIDWRLPPVAELAR